jgi:flagellar biosynthesis protein FlhB
MAADNRTERATPRRRQKAREQGQVVRSRELVASLATLTAVLTLAAQASAFPSQWRALLGHDLDTAVVGDLSNNAPLSAAASLAIVRSVGLVMALAWMAALVGALGQGGLVLAPAALQPKLSRLSPGSRLEQLFSFASVGRLLKSLLPGAAVVLLALGMLRRDWIRLLSLPRMAIGGLVGFSLGWVFEIAWKSALVLLAWAGADYLIERHKFEGDLRMSKQELKEEYKETEGHPAIKARIRRLQRQLRRRRMLEDVKRAAVVITNPNEFAVALEYHAGLAAPKVVAKGRNLFAQQIKQIARWQGIPLIENPPLAHALYRAAEVGQSIPPKLYAVVASVLAAIYRAEESARARMQQASAAARGVR